MKPPAVPSNPDVAWLLKKHEQEPEHTLHVARLAERLFEELQAWHCRGPAEREYLRCAAALHDIGWSLTPTGQGHHKLSARLIAEHPWTTFSPREVSIVAQIARYHRKALPQPEHADYQALAEADRQLVSEMAALLRVADGLDRTHRQIVTNVHARLLPQAIEMDVEAGAPCEPELEAAAKKGDLLEAGSKRPLRFRHVSARPPR